MQPDPPTTTASGPGPLNRPANSPNVPAKIAGGSESPAFVALNSVARRIYVASSWRNIQRVKLAATWLRSWGYSVYDFTEDDDQGAAFNWQDIDPAWTGWSAERFREQLWHPVADRGFNRDFNELREADALLLMLPCGRSAHLELGYAIGAGKPTAIVLQDGEPELMYRAVGKLCLDLTEAVDYFNDVLVAA